MTRANHESLDILVYSSLFPSREQPRHGIFVEQRLRQLMNDFPVESRVASPVPWFPLRGEMFGEYGAFARTPVFETRDGLEVWHPRYPVLPKISWHISPWLLYRATLPCVRAIKRERPFQLIDAHFFYPDGVAAVMLGRELGVPVCITARGSDITLMPNYVLPDRWIRWAATRADGLITVASALRDRMAELGLDPGKVTVLRKGVDLERFAPANRDPVRAELGVEGKLLLCVGNLIELKGQHLVIEALRELPDCTFALIGEGPERLRLERLAVRMGVAPRVHFVGLVPQHELKRYYSAADALVLASSREGWANVLLESMACGTAVVATGVFGTPEVVTAPAAGVLVNERSARGMAAGINKLFAHPPGRDATRRYAESFSWAATSRGQYELFRAILARRASQ